jgi:hypothetical protein
MWNRADDQARRQNVRSAACAASGVFRPTGAEGGRWWSRTALMMVGTPLQAPHETMKRVYVTAQRGSKCL